MDLKTTLKRTEGVAKYSHTRSEHCSAALAVMHRMKKDFQMTDVVLKVDNGCIQAHRLVLASASDYFFSMFNGDMLEKQLSEIVLRDINLETLKLLVDYLYTGDIQITEDNVESLLSASSLLQIWPVREGCSEFLQQHLHPLNFFGIWRFADTLGLTDLKDKSLKYVRHYFQQAVNSEEFLLLSFSELEEVISSNQLDVDSEEKVFLAVLKWVKHSELDRIQFVKKLLSYVRLQLISMDFLMNTITSEVLVRDSVEYKELLYEIMKSILSPEKRTSSGNVGTSPRTVGGLEEYIFAIGGFTPIQPSSEGEEYNPRTDKWLSIAPMNSPRHDFGVTNVSRKLYAIGGCVNGSSCESYDPETNTWSRVTSMKTGRSCLGACSLHEIVYACGGNGQGGILSSVEKYDPFTGVWSSCPPMGTAKCDFGTAVIDNCIYTLGGSSGGTCELRIVERLDPREGIWRRLPDLKITRNYCSATSVNSVLYCIGGYNNSPLASGERFDIRNNKWEDIIPMHVDRCGHQVVNCGDGLIALGGKDSYERYLNSVERYDIELNQWTPLAPMLKARAGFGALSLDRNCKLLQSSFASMDLKTTLKRTEGVAKYSHTRSEHCSAALAVMHRMKKDFQMTDVVLKVDNGCIQAHRLVLASASDYFFSMFNGDMLEKQLSEIVLRDINLETLKLLVDYLYTGDIQITEDNVESLLSASSLLQIWPVREGCSEFLQQHLHPLNCFGIWRFADTFGLTDLKDESLKYVRHNFQQAVNSEEFLLLSFSELEEVISSNQLDVDSEEKVFLAVLKWVKHSELDRIQFVKKLLSYARLQLISMDFLMNTVASEVLVRDSVEYKELLYEIMKSILSPEKRTSSGNVGTSPRTVGGLEEYIFAIGGFTPIQPSSEGEEYNPRTDKWLSIAPMNSPRHDFGVTNVSRKLYAIGGCENGSSCESYDPETNTWSSVTSMKTGRSCLGVCSLHEIVYACGGNWQGGSLSSVEKYDPFTGVWSSCPSMGTAKYSFGTAVIDNCIYTLGGISRTSVLRIVECLDPREGIWRRLPDMKSARGFCSATSVNSLLYCTGGYNRYYSSLATGERFDIRNNKWEDIIPMHSARCGHQVVNCGDGLIALGGKDSYERYLNSVERYDIELNQWTPLAPMLKARAGFGALSLDRNCKLLQRWFF